MSNSSRDHAFVTFAQSKRTRDEIVALVAKRGAVGGIVAREPHLNGGFHFHAAIYGNFRVDRFATYLHRDMPGEAVDVLYQHKPDLDQKTGKPVKKGKAWAFHEMVDYVTVPVKEKEVDKEPIYFGAGCVDSKSLVEAYFGATDNVLAKLRVLKNSNTETHSVIEYLIGQIPTHESAYLYRMWMDFWTHVPKEHPRMLPKEVTPRAWQMGVINWSVTPVTADTNGRGMWLNLPPDQGKSWLQEILRDYFPGDIFRPGIRPHGGFDLVSMKRYNGQKLILIEDVRAHTDEFGKVHWKGGFVDLIKRITDVTPICLDFGMEHLEIYVNARVIITSNFPLPQGGCEEETYAISRRYLEMNKRNMNSPFGGLKPSPTVG